MSSSHSDPACADPNCSYRAEAEMAVETRENANTVSLRVEDENRRLREALDMAVYHAENLRRYIDRVPVRDLEESEAGFQKAQRLLEESRRG